MKRIVSLLVLTCVLAGSVLAGEIPMVVGTASAPSQPPVVTMEPGNIPTVGSSYEIADTALDLIQMLIGVGI